MFDSMKFIVVEDIERDRMEVLSQLSDQGFKGSNCLACPATYQDAVQAIADHAHELDLVFLDLNLPKEANDPRPSKGIGQELLDLIHKSYNPRADIRVIVISGEDVLDGYAQTFARAWPGTVVSVVQKNAIGPMLKASLKRLKKDPMAQAIRRAGLAEVLGHYEGVVDAESSIGDRTKHARALAIRLVRNEVDHFLGTVDATKDYADKLLELIRDHIEPRFDEKFPGRRYIDIGKIRSAGGWGAFLWRGCMVQHLYALNQYRNNHEHLREQPYAHSAGDDWTIPREVMESVSDGRHVDVVVEAIVRDLLEWYLPWHEQVYRPWREAQP